MNETQLKAILLSLSLLLLAGCVGTTPAPVSDRPVGRVVEKSGDKAENVEVKPGFYRVNKGDTLYSIALNHGQDHKDIAAWNGIGNPDLIEVGQMLRVAPPEGGAVAGSIEMRPIAPPIQIESRSGDSKPEIKPVDGAATTSRREPKGGTLPYSEAAWAEVQRPLSAPEAAPTTAAVKPTDETNKPAAVVPSSATATTDGSNIVWSWPTENRLSAPFSEGGNKGLDFSGSAGDPVLAAASGKVTLVTNSLRGYGNLIVVKHNASYLSVYAHNSKMLVKEGQVVAKGQKIAEIGSTDSDKPKLHFEIRREGKPVDPTRFLPQR